MGGNFRLFLLLFCCYCRPKNVVKIKVEWRKKRTFCAFSRRLVPGKAILGSSFLLSCDDGSCLIIVCCCCWWTKLWNIYGILENFAVGSVAILTVGVDGVGWTIRHNLRVTSAADWRTRNLQTRTGRFFQWCARHRAWGGRVRP